MSIIKHITNGLNYRQRVIRDLKKKIRDNFELVTFLSGNSMIFGVITLLVFIKTSMRFSHS